MSYFKSVLISIDQLVNALFGGWPDETLSARCYRMGKKSNTWYLLRLLIDGLFFWQKDEEGKGRRHCEQCYWYERERKDMPEVYRRKGKK